MYFGDMDEAINRRASVTNQLGLDAGGARLSGYEGQSLPASTYTGHDRAAVPWHPDSPVFWAAVIAAGTLVGFFGASVNVRAGKARAGAEINK